MFSFFLCKCFLKQGVTTRTLLFAVIYLSFVKKMYALKYLKNFSFIPNIFGVVSSIAPRKNTSKIKEVVARNAFKLEF